MSKFALLAFWVLWLLDVLVALFGYREFISGVFGRYASASPKYIALWVPLLLAMLLILYGSLHFKNQGQSSTALLIAAIPIAISLPYLLFLAVAMSGNKGGWH